MVTNIQSSLAQAWRPRLVLATALLALHMVLAIPVADSSSKSCHCMPTDPCWPSTSEWNKLNSSVEGRLVQTHPIGSPCHDPTYDAAKCQFLQQQWTTPELHDTSSSSIMAPFFANRSCDPFTPREWPCTLGNYVDYSINVTTPSDVSKGLAFAKSQNIRLIIRNTGHDYFGRSTGAGSLAIWTHYLKDITFFDYKDDHYNGKAMKMGAGVQGFEAYAAADKAGLAVVGGECPTVGLAGGYTQGGGHSALGSSYGLGADQTLAIEVVTAEGASLTATRSKHSDLFWALSGGGGGNYAVVMSMTVRAHPDKITTGAKVSFVKADTTDEAYWEAIEFYHSIAHTFSDVGGMTVFIFTAGTFNIMPLTMPGKTADDVKALLQPLFDKLNSLSIPFKQTILQSPSYLAHYKAMFDPIGVGTAQYGGWLMPQTVIDSNNKGFTAASRNIVNDGGLFIGVSINVSTPVAGDVYNAVLPAWRTAGISVVLASPWIETDPWEVRVAYQNKMTFAWLPQFQSLSPDSGCYINEGDFQATNWKHDFFGVNYDRLRKIKNKYDPEHLFYVLKAVDSDYWTIQPDGRLCKSAHKDQ